MDDFCRIVLYFSIFSVFGYLAEVLSCAIWYRKLLPRGFLFGPYLPIYGFGGLIVTFATMGTRDNLALTFLISLAVCSVLEYITSYLLEKIFKVRWWDYSSDKYNLHGRVCVRTSLLFGICGCIFMFQVLPIIDWLIDLLPRGWQIGVSIFMLVVFILDAIVSSFANSKIKNMKIAMSELTTHSDQTATIKRTARKAVKQFVTKKRKKN